MKIAILADIHANYQALASATVHLQMWHPDHVIIAGDLVNRGPRPAECLNFVIQRVNSDGWLLVRGNHEDYVIQHDDPQAPRAGPEFEVHRASYWTFKKLNKDVSALRAMPDEQILTDPAGGRIQIVHGSILGIRDGIYPETSDERLKLKIGLDETINKGKRLTLFGVGHTHRLVNRLIEGVRVVNAGSVGLPFDGDTRLTYAQLTWMRSGWEAKLIRLEYDRRQAEQDFFTTGYFEEGGPLVRLVQIELQTASSLLYNWARDYQQVTAEGKISVEKSVEYFLNDNFS